MMHRPQKPPIHHLNHHLTCKLCNGYFIDATTIIECLHTFCRTCIVKYLQTNKYCPVCDVQVHKTKPLLNIRPDRTLQDMVYKLVPRLLQNEVQRRKEFYKAHPAAGVEISDIMASTYPHLIASDESLSLKLSYFGCKDTARYLRCPAAVTCRHLQKLIRAKYALDENYHRIDILLNQDCLPPHLNLMDLVYIYKLKRHFEIELTFRIYQYTKTESCSSRPEKENTSNEIEPNNSTNNLNNNNTWKEVQLRISENGEMSITGIQNNEEKTPKTKKDKPKKEIPELKPIESVDKVAKIVPKPIVAPKPPEKVAHKRKMDAPPPIVAKKAKKEVERPGTPCYMPKPVINIPKPSTSVAKSPPASPKPAGKASKVPIGYTTLRDPPKSWNSQISSTKTSGGAPTTPVDAKKPAKFFKMRQNMPRYLGNPASGVKPMYQVHNSPEKEKTKTKIGQLIPNNSNDTIKKHSIVKIDPKTLKPISEKAPDTTSLMTTNTPNELKINTSSVSIFNPLKLANSTPKSGGTERKSPKSPKISTTTKNVAPMCINELVANVGGKRDKMNLNFTPSNPFIPNLASPTMSPNQFLYPGGTGGAFPSPYDPRVMAAYQHMLYTRSMAFSPRINFDLNAAVQSPLVSPGRQLPSSASSPSSSSTSAPTNHHHNNNHLMLTNKQVLSTSTLSHSNQNKKKETTSSSSTTSIVYKNNEKSLQNTVEKLTQNRVKEINKTNSELNSNKLPNTINILSSTTISPIPSAISASEKLPKLIKPPTLTTTTKPKQLLLNDTIGLGKESNHKSEKKSENAPILLNSTISLPSTPLLGPINCEKDDNQCKSAKIEEKKAAEQEKENVGAKSETKMEPSFNCSDGGGEINERNGGNEAKNEVVAKNVENSESLAPNNNGKDQEKGLN